MSRRSRAREVALQVLYQDDLNPAEEPRDAEPFLRGRLTSGDLVEFASALVQGVRRNQSELDAILEATAENWTVNRMAATDRNVLRLGAFELVYLDTPSRVAINEAVELAKRFGSGQSAHFVNGVLDRVLFEHGRGDDP